MRKQIFRFMIVGVMNTVNYYIIYLLLLLGLSLPYIVSHLIALVLSIIGSFYMNSYFTYQSKPTLKKFLTFPLTYVVNIAVTTGALYTMVDLLGWHEVISPFIASLAAIPFTFLLSKYILVDSVKD